MTTRLDISFSDIRNLLSDKEDDFVRYLLEDGVLSIDEAMDCYSHDDVDRWLFENAEDYDYVMVKDE